MAEIYKTLADHNMLLGDRGFLDPAFKPGGTIGYWVRELEEEFEKARFNAIGDGNVKRFSISTTGQFIDLLDRVHFTFYYKYDPVIDALTLTNLHVRLGKTPMKFKLNESGDLPQAMDIYHSITLKSVLPKKPNTLLDRLKADLKRQSSQDDLNMDPTKNVWHPRH